MFSKTIFDRIDNDAHYQLKPVYLTMAFDW